MSERKQVNFTIVPDETTARAAHLRQLLRHRAHAVRLHAHLLRGACRCRRRTSSRPRPPRITSVRAPVRARVVVPVQFVPNLIAALQENLRMFQESYQNADWSKGPVH